MCVALLALSPAARADDPLSLQFDFAGNSDFFATGGAMAIDGPDADTTRVDTLVHPAITTVAGADLPQGATLRKAFLYWGGSIPDGDDCADPQFIDDVVTFTPPGEGPSVAVANQCYCSGGGAQSYDVQLCRAEVTDSLGALVGDYAVDDFNALIANGTTNNASFSIVLIYTAPELPTRRVALYDGLLTMWDQGVAQETVILDQIAVDDPPEGDLTWYALEGDAGGGAGEAVSVSGSPGNLSLDLQGPINPIDNPMNHTINTTVPVQLDALGVDIDQFDIAAALSAGDTSVETTYRAGGDKYWIAYNIVGVNIFAPNFTQSSTKTWELHLDADNSQDPSPGDTIRYIIHVENTGDALGVIDIEDIMPAQVASWTLVDAGGGADLGMGDTLAITGIELEPGQSSEVIFDVVLADDSGGQDMINVASFTTQSAGGGALEAAPVAIADAGPGDGDGDPSGDGDGDPSGDGDGDGDAVTTGDESGSDGGATTSGDEDGGGSEGGFTTDGFGQDDSGGCSCRTRPTGPAGPAGLGLFLLALVGLRPRDSRRDPPRPR